MQIPAVASRPAVRTGSHMQDGVNAIGDLPERGCQRRGDSGLDAAWRSQQATDSLGRGGREIKRRGFQGGNSGLIMDDLGCTQEGPDFMPTAN